MSEKRIAVYGGSFDPITNGHIQMIRKAEQLFDGLIVVVAQNSEKKYTFSLSQRLQMVKDAINYKHGTSVGVVSMEGKFLVSYAKELGAQYVVRGIRSAADQEYERMIRHVNGDIEPDIETVFLMPSRELSEISSSLVKGLVGNKGWEEVVSRYVPSNVFAALQAKVKE
jgi:pantetheine-phosphate adenylyltransferase